VEKIVERVVVQEPLRRRLPDTRQSITHKFSVGGHEGYLTVGLYDDGRPGEVFITMAKEGSTVGGLMDSLGTAISVALQYGVPIESLVNKFTHQRFEPSGMTHNPDIPFAKSLVDYIFRWMGMQFIPGYRAANAPQRGIAKDAPIEKSPEASAEKEEGGLETQSRLKVERPGNGHRGNGHDGGNGKGNGSGNGHEQETGAQRETALTAAMREMQADAPACDVCGTITVRSGTCYKCLNCGHSMGCS
jgi:ribonucleoside-diphosphate reductase alpha chain